MKRESETTMKDIAEAMGLSRSTVSRALQDHPHINAKTKSEVKKVAKKLGYQYNAVAASLRKSSSTTIGLIVPRISRYYQSTVITAIQNKLYESNYNLMICQSNESPEIEKSLINALYTSRVAGLIVSPTLYTEDFSVFDIFSESSRPLVIFDRVPKNYLAHKIQSDDRHGGYLTAKHLLMQGCRRIAYIGGVQSCNIYRERYHGYLDALAEFGVELDRDIIFFHDLTRENAVVTFQQLLNLQRFPDSILAGNDTVALEIVNIARNFSIKLPDDLKIVGYSNDPLTEIVSPKISSVEQCPYEVGVQSAALMLDLINQTSTSKKNFFTITVPVEFVERESSRRREAHREILL